MYGFYPITRFHTKSANFFAVYGVNRVLPLQFKGDMTRKSLNLDGTETFDIKGLTGLKPLGDVNVTIHRKDGKSETITVQCRIDNSGELDYYKNGGVLHYVLRSLAA